MADFSVIKSYRCKYCHFETRKKDHWDRHLQTRKHISIINGKKSTSRYFCETCNYCTNNKSDYIKHLQTTKHKNKVNMDTKSDANVNSEYSHLIADLLIKQNALLEQRMDLESKIINMAQNNTTNNITNNTTINNNHFNLNFFLNEKCKDAMNIEDFINTLELCPFDVAETGRLGYVEGISRIFMNKLNQLDIYNRPLHCTDLKRETLYIKEDNKWEKDNEQKDKLQSIVEQIANKNYEQLPIWQQQNPNHLVANSTECELFMDIACNILGGGNEQESSKFRNRIMRNVMKEVTVSKHLM